MTTSIGCREPEVYDAQRRVQAERPGTEGSDTLNAPRSGFGPPFGL
jgi:hypothetical protein